MLFMEPVIRVATINMFNDLSRWRERGPFLARGLAEQSLDLIALQEVTRPLAVSSAHWLAEQLGKYSVWVSPKTGWERRHEGIAILSRVPVERHEILDLGSERRTAQFVQVRCGDQVVVLINGHFQWLPWAHRARVRQVERLLDWVATLNSEFPVVVCGDFNATPNAPAIALMRQSFKSAHAAHHGCEPDYTCPTPLILGRNLRGRIVSGALRLASIRSGTRWQATLDYIFVTPAIRVRHCAVILGDPSPDDPTLYASDHLGLVAQLEIASLL